MSTKNATPHRTSAHDVIVVGGRVAGASTAMLLARRGIRVLLLEKAAAPGTDTLSTLALMRAGVLQLRRWGLLDRIKAAGTPAIRRTIVHYGDEAVVVPVKQKAGVDELFAPRRTVLDRILVEAAAEAGADVRFGSTVNGFVWNGDAVAGVQGRDRGGRAFEARAPLVIGADGRHSVVARAVNPAVTWQGTVSGACLYAFWTGVEAPGYEWFYRPGSGAGVIPTNDGRVLVWVGTDTERFVNEISHDVENGFQSLMEEAAPEAVELVAEGKREGRIHGFPGAPSYLRKPWGPGWALVGDAGSFRDPLSAHGISDALRDSEFLARAVPSYLDDSSGNGAPLAAYERHRDEAARPLAEIMDVVASYQWTMPELQELLKAFSKAMNHEVDMLAALDAVSAKAA
jgi:flavin-dependent dehydrogenase